jgi:hypothetical protein
VNENAARLLGYGSAREMIGRDIEFAIIADERNKVVQRVLSR